MTILVKAKKIDGCFAIICPKCKTYSKIPQKKLVGKHTIKIRCTCGEQYGIEANHRDLHRKETYLEGYFERVHKKWQWEKAKLDPNMTGPKIMNCRITDISKNGMGFTPLGRQHDIEVDHLLIITFYLDDYSKTVCLKKLIVRGVHNNKISCEFSEDDKKDPKIGYYLL